MTAGHYHHHGNVTDSRGSGPACSTGSLALISHHTPAKHVHYHKHICFSDKTLFILKDFVVQPLQNRVGRVQNPKYTQCQNIYGKGHKLLISQVASW